MDINELLKVDYEKWKDRGYIFRKENGEFKAKTFGEFIEDTYSVANYLLSQSLKDEKIFIFADNSYELMISDLAVTSFVGVSVVISKDLTESSIIKMLRETGAKAMIYADNKKDIVKKIEPECDIVYINMDTYKDVLSPAELFGLTQRDENICSKVVFSSGTTGPAKGVMLSIKNIFSGYKDLRKRVQFNDTDKDYLFLPLNHTYGSIYNFYYSLIDGFCIYLSSGTANIAAELLEVNPTMFCAVPLVYQKLLDAYKENINLAFGKNIKYLFCGGALCTKEMRDAFKELNFLQAYALSETSSSFSIDYPDARDDYSCGTIFESIDAGIYEPDENGIGEIIVKGDNVFLGYLDEELTAKVFDGNGYFHTGDLGYIKDNKLYLKGRKKKILVGANGENIDVDTLCSLLMSLSGDISNVKLSLNGGKLFAGIYVTNTDLDIDGIIEKYNGQVMKYEQIGAFELIQDNIDKRLK